MLDINGIALDIKLKLCHVCNRQLVFFTDNRFLSQTLFQIILGLHLSTFIHDFNLNLPVTFDVVLTALATAHNINFVDPCQWGLPQGSVPPWHSPGSQSCNAQARGQLHTDGIQMYYILTKFQWDVIILCNICFFLQYCHLETQIIY